MRAGLMLVVALLVTPPAFADTDTETVHFAAHFGLSYALQIGAYGIASRALRLDDTDALILSAVTVFAAGAARQVLSAGSGPVNTRGLWQNALGIAAAAGTIWVFDF